LLCMVKNMTRRITKGKNDKSIQGFQGNFSKELTNWQESLGLKNKGNLQPSCEASHLLLFSSCSLASFVSKHKKIVVFHELVRLKNLTILSIEKKWSFYMHTVESWLDMNYYWSMIKVYGFFDYLIVNDVNRLGSTALPPMVKTGGGSGLSFLNIGCYEWRTLKKKGGKHQCFKNDSRLLYC
jgi:hypothetical protein